MVTLRLRSSHHRPESDIPTFGWFVGRLLADGVDVPRRRDGTHQRMMVIPTIAVVPLGRTLCFRCG